MSGQDSPTSTSTEVEPKRRGVGFPQLSLRESIDAIVILGQHGASHSHDAAAAYLGHSTANSGAFRSKLASLRDWGLIERGARDRVTLSDLAQHLVLEAPEHDTAKRLLLAAFESCRVFGVLYNDSAKTTPLDVQRVRTTVVMRHGVASEQADKFVDSFIDSVVYAGLGRFDGSKLTLLPREATFEVDDSSDALQESTVNVFTSTPSPVRGSPSSQVPTVAHEAIPVALRQAWPIDGGEIEFVIRTSEPLPPTIYALVAEMAEVAARMMDRLTGPLVELTTDNPSSAYRADVAPEPSVG